jgi:hypothetical protein
MIAKHPNQRMFTLIGSMYADASGTIISREPVSQPEIDASDAVRPQLKLGNDQRLLPSYTFRTRAVEYLSIFLRL